MKNKKKIVVILIAVMLLACLGSVLGITLSRWSSGEGDTTVAPQVGVVDWNTYEKYVKTVDDGVGLRIVGFTGTTAIEDVILPKNIGGKNVVSVSNSLYADTTDKSIPKTLKIPTTITSIDAGAFSGLTNLAEITFDGASQCNIGMGAFMGCNAVKTFNAGAESNIVFGTQTLSSSTVSAFRTYVGLPSTTVITIGETVLGA